MEWLYGFFLCSQRIDVKWLQDTVAVSRGVSPNPEIKIIRAGMKISHEILLWGGGGRQVSGGYLHLRGTSSKGPR